MGWNMVVDEKMIQEGNNISTLLIQAAVCKSMNGIGSGLTWDKWVKRNKSNPNFDLLMKYVNDEIDSVTAIYIAMRRASIHNI